ncbi:MAG TPA: ABC transporter ATP-binding protein [Rectinemataceae bacterium]|nr:ABC transporter ATP-binding protein [Rectinemataceae bacterium]
MAERRVESPATLPAFGVGRASGGGPAGGPGGGARWLQGAVKAKNARGTLRRLWSYFGPERGSLALVAALVAASGCFVLLGPWLIGRCIDAMSGSVDFSALGAAVTALLAAYVMDAAVNVTQLRIMAGTSQRIVYSLRSALFAKLQHLPISFFDTRSHGDLMSRLANDIDNVSGTISQSTTQLMSTVITIAGSFVMMLVLSPPLTLAALVTLPLVLLLTRTISRKTRVLFKEQQVILGALNGHIEESVSGIHVVKAFGREEASIERFEALNARLRRVGTKAQVWSGFIMPLMNVINNIGFAAVALAGGALAVRGLVTVGVIASFIGYSRQFARPLNDLANIYNTLQTAVAGAERVFEILDEAEESADPPDAIDLDRARGEVRFSGVGFGYRPDVAVLRDIDFEAPSGSVTALVGPTGAGKTTIVNLLARFYDPSLGRILIDGIDIKSYRRDSLRRCFGIVLQDTYLFSGSIRENLLYGNPDADESEMVRASRMANADQFIRRLPRGYDSPLTESGSNLSEGQRQLLAIARAILTDPAILILDEATSSVDTRTELHIQEAMLALMRGRTSFIIAHRLSTIRDADRIMVIDGGRIVESGNHESLVRGRGIYARMYESQTGGLAGLED